MYFIKGLGASKKNIDNWLENASNYEDLLQRLADEPTDGTEKKKEKKKEKKSKKDKKRTEDKSKVEKKIEKKMKIEKDKKKEKKKEKKLKDKASTIKSVDDRMCFKRKLLKGKNVSNYNEKDLQAILGIKSIN